LENQFGFFSLYPYDLSAPRFSELGNQIALAIPTDSLMRWRENSRMVCARYLDVERRALLQIGNEKGLGKKIFHLRLSEIDSNTDWKELKKRAEQRQKVFEENKTVQLPNQLALNPNGELLIPMVGATKEIEKKDCALPDFSFELNGISVGSQKAARGKAVWVKNEKDLAKNIQGNILLSETLFPELTIGFKQIAGLVSASGGKMAHAAIVAREYDLPCIVQVQNLSTIQEGDWLELDGKTGKMLVLKNKP
jgi:phosphohistidine swiveling domain-containing protein